MSVTQKDTPQTNSQSNQNFDPDIRKMYKHFVTGGNTPDDNDTSQSVGIDDLRGQISVNVTGQTSANLIKALNIDPTTGSPAPTTTTSTPVQLAQESRCHAFYRIIGFPVVSEDKKTFYNPGFDIIKQVDSDGNPIKRKLDLSKKLSIASNVGSKFEDISKARESYAAATAQIFSVPESVEAGVLALTSGTYGNKGNVNIRKFAQPFLKNTSVDAFDFSIDHQSYSSPGDITSTYSAVGNKEIRLSDYQSPNGDPNFDFKPNPGLGSAGILFSHKHIIVPFMVDPRIDFSIWASESKTTSGLSRRVAVPFVPDASFLKTSDTAKAERPLIEKIITEQSSLLVTEDAGNAVVNAIDYVKANKDIQTIYIGGVKVGDIFSGSVFKTGQQQSFAQYLLTIDALMAHLVASMNVIHAAQGLYYWLPIPSSAGPENGCDIRDVPLNQNISTDLITVPYDFDIIKSQVQAILSSINSTIAQPTATPDPGSYAFSNYKLTFDSATSDSQGDWGAKTQESVTKRRNRVLTKAGEALQIVEMIMGEFSGLGLADIIAVMGALYTMPYANLLGFLDEDAIDRAEVILKQPTGSLRAQRADIITSMDSLASFVNGFYQIMDQVFQDYLNNNALTH